MANNAGTTTDILEATEAGAAPFLCVAMPMVKKPAMNKNPIESTGTIHSFWNNSA